MLNRIIRFSLTNRAVVLWLTGASVLLGVVVIERLDVDVFPDLNRPTVTIFTEAHGLATEEVETLVTLPIESAMNGATNVERVRSAFGHRPHLRRIRLEHRHLHRPTDRQRKVAVGPRRLPSA